MIDKDKRKQLKNEGKKAVKKAMSFASPSSSKKVCNIGSKKTCSITYKKPTVETDCKSVSIGKKKTIGITKSC